MMFIRRNYLLLVVALVLSLSSGVSVSSGRAFGALPLPRSFGSSVTISGLGSGHGDGLSQWGALGYAVSYGWDWTEILDHYYGGTTRSSTDPEQVVRVNLLAMNDKPFTVVVQETGQLVTNADGGVGRYRSVIALETSPNTYRVYGRSDVMDCAASATQAGLDLPESGWRLLNAAFVSVSTAARIEVSAPAIDAATSVVATLPGVCRPDGVVRHYRGSIEIVNGTDGENRTVNAVPLEQYLRGVVPQESIASWGDYGGGKGMQALLAQAVAARSYVLSEHRATYAQSCDTTDCQMYSGAGQQSSLSAAVQPLEDSRTDAAVAATSGVVLRNADGNIAYTQFGAASGGYTAGRNFPAVEDLGDSYGPNTSHSWTVTIPRTTIEEAFPTVGQLIAIDVVERNGLGEWGGRAVKVRVRGTSASTTVTGDAFRAALHLKSNWISIASGCVEGPRAAPRTTNASGFHPMNPVRIVDTRQGLGGTRLDPKCVLTVHVAGAAGISDAVDAVALNITTVGTLAAGFLSAFACDQGKPSASSVNARTESPVANMAFVPVDNRGDVCIFSDPGTDLIVDVAGWFGRFGDGFSSIEPARIVDSRDGLGVATGVVSTKSVTTIDLAATHRLSGQPTAVALNVTATGALQAGFLTVFPCGATVPTTSNVNVVVGRDVANLAVSAVSANGTVCIYSEQPTHVIVDLLGAFGAGDTFMPVGPNRLLDSRDSTPLDPGQIRVVPVGKATGSVAVNLTATGSTAAGFVTAFPCGGSVPGTSNLNVAPGRDTANQALLRVGTQDAICLVSSVKTDIIVDVQGTFD